MKHIKKIIKIIFLICFVLVAVFSILVCISKYVIETKSPEGASPINTDFIKISDNEEIAYQEIDYQASTTIVFVGGLSGWSGSWTRTMQALDNNLNKDSGTKSDYNFLAIDLPPFGFSKVNLNKDFFRTTQAKRINEFLDTKVKGDIIFVAHSYGAGPVAEALMNEGRRVKKFVVVDGVLNIDEPQRETPKKTLLNNKAVVELFINAVGHSHFLIKNRLASFVYKKDHVDNDLTSLYMASFGVLGTSKKLAYWLVDYMSDRFLNAVSTKSASYKALEIPVRIIWGDKDKLTTPDLAFKLSLLLKDQKIYMLKDVGHIPMIEDYKQLDDALLTAIKE